MKRNQQELMDIMYYHKLKVEDVARITNTKVSTVRVWRCKSSIAMPHEKLTILKNFIAEKSK